MSGCQTCGGFGGHHDPIAHDWLARTDEDCPVACDPAFLVPVAPDEAECRMCGRGCVLGDDE